VDHNFFAPAYRRQGSASLREEKRKKELGAPQFCGVGCKAAKTPRPPEVKPSRPQFLCASAPLREEKKIGAQRRLEPVRGGGLEGSY